MVARAITHTDLADYVAGINASLALIPQTGGGDWPTEAVTEEYNYVDPMWHECEFRDGGSYKYVLRNTHPYIRPDLAETLSRVPPVVDPIESNSILAGQDQYNWP